MSAPRPLTTDPFHPLGSFFNNMSFLYEYQNVPVIYSKCCVIGCLGNERIQQLRVCFLKTLSVRLKAVFK